MLKYWSVITYTVVHLENKNVQPVKSLLNNKTVEHSKMQCEFDAQ